MELKGLCKNCLGCNRLENKEFKGVYRCAYATVKQLELEDLSKEFIKDVEEQNGR